MLAERLAGYEAIIIPPSEANVIYANGKVANADAMSKEFIENPIIRQYVDDPKCTVILFENPPYQDSTAITFTDDNGERGKAQRTGSFVNLEYRKISSMLNEGKASAREISNLFIWSGFEYYLRQDTDAYILFSPIKYWKNVGLAKKELIKGFLFNRKYFHATESAIACTLWSNQSDATTESIQLDAYDIVNSDIIYLTVVEIKKAHSTLIELYDKRFFDSDIETSVWVAREGVELGNPKADIPAIWNENIIGNLGAPAFALDVKNKYLVRGSYYHHGCVFPLRSDNYLDKLPLWVAKMFPQDNWYEKDVYNTTADGGDAYTHDPQFLKSCLIYTCLSNQNKCLTFDGSDGRHYQNELCFDNTDPNRLPLALTDLNKYAAAKETALDDDEVALMDLWYKIMNEAKRTANYNPAFTYGVYQITKELNTFKTIGTGKSKRIDYDDPELNGDLESLRKMLKEYYKSHITAKMFQYELLK